MHNSIRILHTEKPSDIRKEFSLIGVDPAGIKMMESKAFQLNIKVCGLSSPAALILKQEMLTLGGDCANHRSVIKNEAEHVDAILMGSLKDFQKLVPKLRQQPFGLKKMADDLEQLIRQKENSAHLKLSIKNQVFDFSKRTYIMGILNITPDSFSDGGDFIEKNAAVEHGIRLVEEGADILDVGAESTRPGAEPAPLEAELVRLIPVLDELKKQVDVPISVDTYKSAVAKAAIEHGADLINDISGLHFDPEMVKVIAQNEIPVVIMHIKGTPKNMQQNPRYDDLMTEIYQYLADTINFAIESGIKKELIIVDPGIGFGKKIEDNYEILRRLNEFQGLGCSILIGPSRKSFVGKVLDLPSDQRVEGTAAAVAIGIKNGAHIVRVHDVKQMKRVCVIADLLSK